MSENVEQFQNVGLAPPWITYFNELRFSIGADPEIEVGPLIPVGSDFIALVTVNDNEKAQAIATLLEPTKNFGNVNVIVVVSNSDREIVSSLPCPLDAFTIAHLFLVALEDNPFFEMVVVQPQTPGGPNAVFPVFKAEVIQFFNDDLSNLCNNFTAVAADVFKDVMKNTICETSILFSTSCTESS